MDGNCVSNIDGIVERASRSRSQKPGDEEDCWMMFQMACSLEDVRMAR